MSELVDERNRLRDEVEQLEDQVARAASDIELARVQARSPAMREIGWGLALSVVALAVGTVALLVWVMVVVSHI